METKKKNSLLQLWIRLNLYIPKNQKTDGMKVCVPNTIAIGINIYPC